MGTHIEKHKFSILLFLFTALKTMHFYTYVLSVPDVISSVTRTMYFLFVKVTSQ